MRPPAAVLTRRSEGRKSGGAWRANAAGPRRFAAFGWAVPGWSKGRMGRRAGNGRWARAGCAGGRRFDSVGPAGLFPLVETGRPRPAPRPVPDLHHRVAAIGEDEVMRVEPMRSNANQLDLIAIAEIDLGLPAIARDQVLDLVKAGVAEI